MLALARSEGQSIIIDGHIEVKVVKWSRSSVRLAIQAPREVRVDRDETWRKMHPGEMTPLEIAEKERNERFAREGVAGLPGGGPGGARPAAGEAVVSAPVAGVFENLREGKAYVVIGSAVAPETVVGTILGAGGVTEVYAGVKGSVVRVLAGGGQTVAAGAGLMLVRVG